MKKIAAIFVFALVAPAVFAAPGQSLRAHDGPTSVGVTRSDRGYDRTNGPIARNYDERPSTAGSSARAASVSAGGVGGAEPDRAAAAAARSARNNAPGPIAVTPPRDESITLEFPRDLGQKQKPSKSSRSELTAAEKERLRVDAENQRWLEQEARAGKMVDKKYKPGELKEALKIWGNAPHGKNDSGMRRQVHVY